MCRSARRLRANRAERKELKQSGADSYSIFSQEKTIIFKLRKFMKDFNGVLESDVNDLFDIEVL